MKNAGASAIGFLFTFLIILGLTAFAINHYGLIGGDNGDEGDEAEERPLEEAMGVECLMRIEAYRDDITMYQAEHDAFPPSIDELGGDASCPVTGALYNYNEETGDIWCPEHD